jgi:type IV secretion system protein VirB2
MTSISLLYVPSLTVSGMVLFVAAQLGPAHMPWSSRSIRFTGGRRTGRQIIAVIIIIVTGLTRCLTTSSGGSRRLIQIVFGLSIASPHRASFVVLLVGGGS